MKNHRAPDDRLTLIRSFLGEPAWQSEDILLYRGDYLQLMEHLPAGLFDLTITSPPYNIGKEYERAMPIDTYVQWCAMWMAHVHRLTVSSGAFWLNLGYIAVPGRGKAVPLPYLLWDVSEFFLIQEVVWNYGAGVAARLMFSPRNEKWLWYVKDPSNYNFDLDAVRDPNVKYPNQKKNGRIRVNQNGKNPTDVWQIPKVTTGTGRTGQRASPERTTHPAQFPEEVVTRIVLASSSKGDVIFDPFVGSGTTAAVALAAGRKCVGFEISGDYIDVATRRLRERTRYLSITQPSLFSSV
jgi:adenine-specific DNA-methyltransferase